MKLYLVLNVFGVDLEESGEERWCLDICSSKEVAESKRAEYIRNFLGNTVYDKNTIEECICIEEVDTDGDFDGVIWNYLAT